MSAVHAVLLVPAEGDPHGLLAEGPCGARPPMAQYMPPLWEHSEISPASVEPKWFAWNEIPDTIPVCTNEEWQWLTKPHRALVLAWNGKPVPEGVFRLWYMADDVGMGPLGDALYEGLDELLAQLAEWCVRGTTIILDADGREIPQ